MIKTFKWILYGFMTYKFSETAWLLFSICNNARHLYRWVCPKDGRDTENPYLDWVFVLDDEDTIILQ